MKIKIYSLENSSKKKAHQADRPAKATESNPRSCLIIKKILDAGTKKQIKPLEFIKKKHTKIWFFEKDNDQILTKIK